MEVPTSSFMSGPCLSRAHATPPPPPGGPAVTRPVQASSCQSADASDGAANGGAFRSILDSLPCVFVGLDRPFFVFHALVICAGSIFGRARQHHGVAAGINHRREVQ